MAIFSISEVTWFWWVLWSSQSDNICATEHQIKKLKSLSFLQLSKVKVRENNDGSDLNFEDH